MEVNILDTLESNSLNYDESEFHEELWVKAKLYTLQMADKVVGFRLDY